MSRQAAAAAHVKRRKPPFRHLRTLLYKFADMKVKEVKKAVTKRSLEPKGSVDDWVRMLRAYEISRFQGSVVLCDFFKVVKFNAIDSRAARKIQSFFRCIVHFNTTGGAVFTWGYNPCGCLGHGDEQLRELPTQVAHFRARGPHGRVLQVAAGDKFTVTLTGGGAGGEVSVSGSVLGRGTEYDSDYSPVPVLCASLMQEVITRISAGSNHIGAVSRTGQLFMWGHN